mgnify:CR=1 FL=1
MKQISKVFLACACSLSGLTTQAQQLVNLDKSTAYLRIGYIGFEQACPV